MEAKWSAWALGVFLGEAQMCIQVQKRKEWNTLAPVALPPPDIAPDRRKLSVLLSSASHGTFSWQLPCAKSNNDQAKKKLRRKCIWVWGTKESRTLQLGKACFTTGMTEVYKKTAVEKVNRKGQFIFSYNAARRRRKLLFPHKTCYTKQRQGAETFYLSWVSI